MPGTLIFLADARDPSDPLTVFGKGHVTDFDAEDDAWVKVLISEGKAAILSTEDVAADAAERAFQQEMLDSHMWPGQKVATTGL